ncbi:MAG: biliverdin-producing heme oxygenase, partial [Planctomycetota bacterium]
REGANNGNRFLAARLKGPLGLAEGGATYLEPYGEEQPALWAAFKGRLDGLELSASERDEVVASAREMFELIRLVHGDFEARLGSVEAAGV